MSVRIVLWNDLALEENATEAHLQIPEHFRMGHEEHFAQVAQRFSNICTHRIGCRAGRPQPARQVL
jgi:hypothetical protein